MTNLFRHFDHALAEDLETLMVSFALECVGDRLDALWEDLKCRDMDPVLEAVHHYMYGKLA